MLVHDLSTNVPLPDSPEVQQQETWFFSSVAAGVFTILLAMGTLGTIVAFQCDRSWNDYLALIIFLGVVTLPWFLNVDPDNPRPINVIDFASGVIAVTAIATFCGAAPSEDMVWGIVICGTIAGVINMQAGIWNAMLAAITGLICSFVWESMVLYVWLIPTIISAVFCTIASGSLLRWVILIGMGIFGFSYAFA